MEKNYNPQNLQTKTIPQLKEILKAKNLKVTGNKQKLINRILESETTYFDLLPSDLKKELDYYQGETSDYNKFVKVLLIDNKENLLKNRIPDRFNNWFRNKGLDIKIQNNKLEIGRLKNLNSDLFIDVLLFLFGGTNKIIRKNIILLNDYLRDENINIRLILSGRNKEIEAVKVEPIKITRLTDL